MNPWWDSLQPRERWLVGSGGLLAVLLLGYALLWQPFQRDLRQLRQSVAAQRQDLAWMQQAATLVKQLGGSTANPAAATATRSGQSLLTLVDQTAKAAGLANAVKRVEPQGSDKLRVQLDNVSFDLLVRWLIVLEQQHRIQIANVTVDRQGNGLVNVRLVLQGNTA
jgi:general secretion pathway protein M